MALRLPPWEDLSKDEQIPIANLPLDKNYVITGGPGTGKTILALHRASRLKQVHGKDKTVSFLVYNKTLKKYLEQAITEVGLDQSVVNNWHKWFYNYYKDIFGGFVPESAAYMPAWDTIIPNWPENKIFDHLILDEAQDLPKGLLKILKKCSHTTTIFADDNQSITDTGSAVGEIMHAFKIFEGRYPLTRNYRNTQQIADVANLFYTGEPGSLPAHAYKSGDKPTVFYVKESQDFCQYISNYADNNPEQNIGVLVRPENNHMTTTFDNIKSSVSNSSVQLYYSGKANNFDFQKDGVKVVSFQSAKGLEFDAVFIPDIDHSYFSNANKVIKNQIYVCCSRAKEKLFFSYTEDNLHSFIFDTFNKNRDKLEWLKFSDSGDIFSDENNISPPNEEDNLPF